MNRPSKTPLSHALGVVFANPPLLLRVCVLSVFLGALEMLGLLSFPALMSAVGWDSAEVMQRLPPWLATWLSSLGELGPLAIALPILAFAGVGTLRHIQSLQEHKLNKLWQEILFRGCLHGMLGGSFPALARMNEQDAAHILCVQTERASSVLRYGLQLHLSAVLLLAQFAVALVIFGPLALGIGVLVGAALLLLMLLRRGWRRIGEDWSQASEALFNEVVSGLRGWDTVLTDRQCSGWLDGFHGHLRSHIDTTVRYQAAFEKTSAGINLGGAFITLALLLGAYALGITGGTLIMFGVIGYRGLPQFKSWIRLLQEFTQQLDAYRAVHRWIARGDHQPTPLLAGPLLPLALRDLSFTYANRPILTGCSLTLPQRGLIGIRGPNGCGKTTLMRILTHLLPADAGTFAFPSGESPAPSVPDFRARVAFLSANPLIWGDTLAAYWLSDDSGLKLDASGHSEASPSAAAARFQLKRAVSLLWENLPLEKVLELDTRDWGRRLSMGMRQKAALLRCLGKQAELICLDEPSQHLDAYARAGLQQILCEHAQSATVLIVSQDETLLAACQQIHTLENGRLVSEGVKS